VAVSGRFTPTNHPRRHNPRLQRRTTASQTGRRGPGTFSRRMSSGREKYRADDGQWDIAKGENRRPKFSLQKAPTVGPGLLPGAPQPFQCWGPMKASPFPAPRPIAEDSRAARAELPPAQPREAKGRASGLNDLRLLKRSVGGKKTKEFFLNGMRVSHGEKTEKSSGAPGIGFGAGTKSKFADERAGGRWER